MEKHQEQKLWRKVRKSRLNHPDEPGVPSRSPAAADSDRGGWMRSGAVAARLGLKTGTLRKWRSEGRGPTGWSRVSATCVMYPVSSVLKFEASWRKGE
jgi:hypothetical protein